LKILSARRKKPGTEGHILSTIQNRQIHIVRLLVAGGGDEGMGCEHGISF
jgi:hypothetical protein